MIWFPDPLSLGGVGPDTNSLTLRKKGNNPFSSKTEKLRGAEMGLKGKEREWTGEKKGLTGIVRCPDEDGLG